MEPSPAGSSATYSSPARVSGRSEKERAFRELLTRLPYSKCPSPLWFAIYPFFLVLQIKVINSNPVEEGVRDLLTGFGPFLKGLGPFSRGLWLI